MSLVIAGERSGVGKTTITLALLSYLRQCGLQVQSFKVGPDYIDPMFHQYVTGLPCRNLDPVLTSEAYVQQCFARHNQVVTHALVEGVMGLFDGAATEIRMAKSSGNPEGRHGNNSPVLTDFATTDFASTAHIARLLNIPVLLVVDCSRMAASIAALVHGYCSFDRRLRFAGLVLNRVGSDRHLALLQSALDTIPIPILGVLHRHDAITIPDRHLGLVPTAELDHLNPLIVQLARLGETCFDWQQLLPLLVVKQGGDQGDHWGDGDASLPGTTHSGLSQSRYLNPSVPNRAIAPHCPSPTLIRIAIAHDAAFSFYYADNLDLLEELGAELVIWSPLVDTGLPDGIQGLYLGGGFPEMFAAQLAQNEAARNAVRTAIQAGMPTYAECGGLMYLCQHITDFEGRSHPMVGVLTATALMGSRLTLGYRQAVALRDGLMLTQGAIAWGHEFHRSQLTQEPETPLYGIGPHRSLTTMGQGEGTQAGAKSGDRSPQFQPPSSNSQPSFKAVEGWHLPNLHASYIHLHWGATQDIPERFLQACRDFQSSSF